MLTMAFVNFSIFIKYSVRNHVCTKYRLYIGKY